MNTFAIILTLFISVTADPLQDLGAPDYTCDASLMAPSKVKPTNVHSVRPADINLVMALGDSLTVRVLICNIPSSISQSLPSTKNSLSTK